MVSLVREGFALSPILLIIVIFFGTVTARANDEALSQVPVLQTADTTELRYGKMFFTLESGANFLSRRDDFDYGFTFEGTSPSPITDLSHTGYDSFGGGAGITVGYPINDKYSIEFSFQGSSAGSERSSRFTSSATSLLAVPVIDGQSFGMNHQFLELRGSPHIRTKLKYETWYVDTFFGLNRTVLKKSNTELHTIVGLSYAHFEQDFEHKITGTRESNGLPNSSDLDEDLRDNLFGLKGGLRLNSRVTRKIQIEGSVFGGAYYRKSKLDADQTLINVLIGNVGFTDASASVNDRDSRIAPKAEGNLKIKYKISDRLNLAFSSGVSAWWHMSKVNNPENTSANMPSSGPSPIDRPVHIGDNDRLMEYHIGLAITFSH